MASNAFRAGDSVGASGFRSCSLGECGRRSYQATDSRQSPLSSDANSLVTHERRLHPTRKLAALKTSNRVRRIRYLGGGIYVCTLGECYVGVDRRVELVGEGLVKSHEVANLFPLMSGDEYASLAADIDANGLREPIWTYQGEIIDGRNRFRACTEVKVAPRFREWDGHGSLVMFIVSLNLHRRHLSSSQKAALAVEVLPMLEAEARQRQIALAGTRRKNRSDLSEQIPQGTGKSSGHAASIFKTNEHYVSDAKQLKADSPEKFEAVRQGSKTLTQAKRELKEEQREGRREENRQKIASVPAANAVQEGAKFATIVIDPPWDWGDEGDVDQLGRARPDYGTMPLADLLKLPVSDLSDTDCHLYLWITNRSLPKGFALMEAWGFRYVTCLTWAKPHFGMGNYFRGQTEHVLFGVKGSQMLKRKDVGTIFHAPRGTQGHSSKPIEFYDLVESCSPGPYLEMFSRTDRADWTHWGEQLSAAA